MAPSLLGIVRIASMSRRRAKCIVSIAGIGRGYSDLLLTRGPAPDTGALWSDVEGHGPGRSTSLRPAAAPDFFRFPCELLVTGPRPIGRGGWPVRPQRSSHACPVLRFSPFR